MDCVITMDTLASEPYLLGLNSKIVARARALNQQGSGQFNTPSNFSTVLMKLIPRDKPRLTEQSSDNSLTLSWNSLFNQNSF